MVSERAGLGLVGLVVLASVVRFSTLGVQSLWLDESVTASIVHRSLAGVLHEVRISEATPPLYYVLAWGWTHVFGSGDVALRSLSALAGVAVVPIVYAICVRIASPVVALVAAALTAVNPFLVWYSQEARAYSLLVCLSALTVLCFVGSLAGERGALAGWAAASALALATHYFALFVVVPEAVWLLLRAPGRRAVLLATGAVAAAGLAILPLAISQRDAGHGGWITGLSIGSRLKDVLTGFVAGETLGTRLVPTLFLGLVAALALVLLLWRARGRDRRAGLGMLALAAAALAVPLCLAGLGNDFFFARNVIVAVVPLTIAVATGFVAEGSPPLGHVAATVAFALALGACIAVPLDRGLQRDDWQAVGQLVGRQDGKAAFLVTPWFDAQPLLRYLPRLKAMPARGAPTDTVIVIGRPDRLAALEHRRLPAGSTPRQDVRVQRLAVVEISREQRNLAPAELVSSLGMGSSAQASPNETSHFGVEHGASVMVLPARRGR